MLLGYFVFQKRHYIKRIAFTGELIDQIDETLERQRDAFYYDGTDKLEIKDFYPGDPASDSYISKIEYDDPNKLLAATENAIALSYCEPSDLSNLVAIFKKSSSAPSEVLVQLIDRRHTILPKSGWLMFKKISEKEYCGAAKLALDSNPSGVFYEMQDIGLQLDNKITAILKPKQLLFKSYFQANRIFDLGDRLAAATDKTVKEFLSLEIISDHGNPISNINTWTTTQRKQVSRVMALGFINKLSGIRSFSFPAITALKKSY